MPPKPKFTREEITLAALEIVSQGGADALTARELGNALHSSARPIFTIFKNMEELQEAVREAAMRRFEAYAAHPLADMPLFKQVGMQMIRFAMQEPKLFQLLFMQENKKPVGFHDMFGALGPMVEICIDAIRQEYGLAEAAAQRLFENVWIYTFGVGALCATKACLFSEAELGEMLSIAFQAMLMQAKQA